jgi:hypothetical protein
MPWKPKDSPGLRRLIERRQELGHECEIVLRSHFVEHQVSRSGALTTHVFSPGERMHFRAKIAADLVKQGFGEYPPGP